jgi:hypothetical protein
MPKVGSTPANTGTLQRLGFASGFRRSAKGNLWRKWGEATLTVFARRDGRYGWVVADEHGPTFGTEAFADERDAIADLWETVSDWGDMR